MITLYWRPEPVCPYCEKAKKLLASREIEYQSIVIGQDISRGDLIAKFPQAQTVPVVTVDGRFIGGYTELYQYVTTNKLMGENYGNKRDKL